MSETATSGAATRNRERYVFGSFRLDVGSRRLSRAGDDIPLPSRALDALAHLIRHRDRIVEKDEIIAAVWAGSFVSDDSLVHCVSVLRRALQDDSERPRFIATLPRRGYQFVSDVEEEVEVEAIVVPPPVPPMVDLSAGAAVPPIAQRSRPSGHRRLAFAAAAFGLLLTLALLTSRVLTPEPNQGSTSVDTLILSQLVPAGTALGSIGVLSPDARTLAFTATEDATGASMLWMRTLDSQVVRRLEGTTGASRPFWSKDGESLAYFAGDKLKVLSLSDLRVRTLASLSVSPAGGTWSGDQIIFGDVGTGLNLIDVNSGATHRLTTLEPATDVAHAWPSFLPDGQHFLFTITGWNKDRTGVWIGSLASHEKPQRLLPDASPATYADSGHLLYIHNDTIVAAPFNLSSGTLEGPPSPIAQNVLLPRVAEGDAFSAAGALMSFRTGTRTEQLVWFNRQGERVGAVDGPTPLRNPTVSPDGKLLLATGAPSREPGLWLVDIKANSSTRLDPDGIGPLWSPDGQRVAFTALGGLDIATIATIGRPDKKVLLHDSHRKVLQTWSPDGRFIVFTRRTPETQLDLWLLPTNEPNRARPLLTTPASERGAAISPDGRWIAYTSDESGRSEVYLQEFPGLGSKRVISTAGGAGAYWRRDGHELFYIAPDSSLMAVELTLGVMPTVGRPRALFRAPMAGAASEARNHYVASPDGRTFLVNVIDESSDHGTIAVMINWAAKLTKPRPDTLRARLRPHVVKTLGAL